MLSRIRSAIEPKINDLKRWCHLQRLRYFTCGRNLIQVMCAAIGANFETHCSVGKDVTIISITDGKDA